MTRTKWELGNAAPNHSRGDNLYQIGTRDFDPECWDDGFGKDYRFDTLRHSWFFRTKSAFSAAVENLRKTGFSL